MSRTAAHAVSGRASMRTSFRIVAMFQLLLRSSLREGARAHLENLAISPGRATEGARRHAGGAMKGPHEVRQVPEADVVRDVRDRPTVARQQARRVAESSAKQEL